MDHETLLGAVSSFWLRTSPITGFVKLSLDGQIVSVVSGKRLGEEGQFITASTTPWWMTRAIECVADAVDNERVEIFDPSQKFVRQIKTGVPPNALALDKTGRLFCRGVGEIPQRSLPRRENIWVILRMPPNPAWRSTTLSGWT